MENKIINSKEVGFMTKEELLSVLNEAFKAEGIQTIQQLGEFLQKGVSFDNQVANKALLEFLKKELADRADSRPLFTTSKAVGEYLAGKYSSLDQEHFIVISVDNVNRIVSEDMVAIGTINKAVISPREIFRYAFANNAASIFICHNHPSGNLLPSNQDLTFTNTICEAGKTLNICLLDHIIVGNGTYLSMAEEEII